MHKSIRSAAICLLTLFSIGLIGQIKATLVIALDLTQSKTIQTGINNNESFYQKQTELEGKLRGMNIRGVRLVKTPHITLFSGIEDTPQNRIALIDALNAVAPLLNNKRIYINITDLSTRGPWNGYYFYVALNAAIQQHKYNGQQSLSQQKLLGTIEQKLKHKNVLNYKKGNADHISLVEVHSSSGGSTSDNKRNQINASISKQNSPLHYPNNFSLPLPQGDAIWVSNITLYLVTRQGPVDIAQDFQKLHSVKL